MEIAEAATGIMGVPTTFLVNATGSFGGCRWNSGHADITSVERAQAALIADDGWLRLIDLAGTCFQAGVTQSVYRRVV